MVITQEALIKQISEEKQIDITVAREVFKTAEAIIFGHLSSTTSTNQVTIKLLDGLSLECNYIPERTLHTYDEIQCAPRIWAKPKITRYYNRKLNQYS